MDVKQGNIQATAAEFSEDFAVVRAKSQAQGWFNNHGFMEKGVNSYYTHMTSITSRYGRIDFVAPNNTGPIPAMLAPGYKPVY